MPRRPRKAIFEKLEWRTLLASISGIEFNDFNSNGTRDEGEPVLPGWTVYLDLNHNQTLNDGEPSAVTGAEGEFSFSNLGLGNYTLAQVVPTGWQQTHPADEPPSLAAAAAAISLNKPAGTTDPIQSAIARVASLRQYSVTQLRSARTWVVGLPQGASIRALTKAVGASSAKASSVLPDTYVLSFPARYSGQLIALRLGSAKNAKFFYPMLDSSIGARSIPDDPLFADQWHLLNTGQNGGTAGQDANVTSVWDDYQGNGVTIGVVDTGVDHTHPDLSPNYNPALSHDFVDDDSDPSPALANGHGTEVAGIAAARGNNGIGISGAAPRAALAAIRLFSGSQPTTDEQIANSLSFESNAIDIYNNSWGPADNGQTLSGPGPLTLAALQEGVTTGRDGKGSIFVWAAGNGLNNNDNVNYDGFANSRYTLAITAIDDNGVQPFYAEPGAPILVSAYSSGLDAGTTTTVIGGGYTNTFGETSSAAPLVSGVVALMLEANPTLSWRDVEHILALSARKNDAGDFEWTDNGAGLHVNNKYGFGAIDAAAAVGLATTWHNVGAETSITSDLLPVGMSIPDNDTDGITSSVEINAQMRVETVEVVFDATHPHRGDLRVVLTSPDGTQSVLSDLHNDPNADYSHWTFTSKRSWDELSKGTWSLKVTDESGGDVGLWNSWQLNIYGTAVDPNTHSIVIAHANDSITGQDFGVHDVAPPTVLSAVYRLPTPQTIALHFDEDLNESTLAATDLVVHPVESGSDVTPSSVAYNTQTHIATFTLPAPLAAGAWTATLAAGSVSDLSGNSLAADYVFNFGEDANPPIADAGGPYGIAEGASLHLDASASTEPDSGESIVSYEWDLNGDNDFSDAIGVSPTVSWATLFGLGVNDNGNYTARVRVTNNLGVQSIDSAALTVTNTAPTSVAINGPTSSPEGTLILLSATVVDPGNDTFDYAWSITKDGNAYATGAASTFAFTPDDNATYVVSLTVTDDDSDSTDATPLTIGVTDVAPTIGMSGNGSVNEGALYTLTLGSITDPGTDTVSLYRITWGDSSPAEMYSPAQVATAGGIFTHTYDDGPADRTITVRLGDEDGMHTAGTKQVHVDNLDPSGTFGSGGDVNIGEDGFVVWLNPTDPSEEDAGGLVYDFDFDNNGTYDLVGSLLPHADVPGSYLTALGPHTVKGRIRDNDGLAADGAARDGVYEQTVTFNVVDASFRVLSFTPNNSGFAVHFNKPTLLEGLNLYDGSDGSADSPDLVVTSASDPGHPMRGSLVWDASTRTATWVATGGVLPNDTYSVTLVTGGNSWTSGGGDNLDGNPNVPGAENYVQNFIVNASSRVVSLPDFARGPDQNVNLPLDLSSGIPITLSNPQGVTSVDFNLFFNPQLLDITAAALASGVPGGWSLTTNFTTISPTLRRLRITMSGGAQLSSSATAMKIVRLTANVPAAAAYGEAQVLRLENVVVNAADGRGDYAVQVAAFAGDANGNGSYSGADSAPISRVVAELDSGFDGYPLIDPQVIVDVDANGQLQGQDAAWVLQKSLSAALRPEIPDIPGGSFSVGDDGPFPPAIQIDLPDTLQVNNGEDLVVPLNITNSASGLMGFNVVVTYDANKLSLTSGSDSVDATIGSLFTGAGGWIMGSYVVQSSGVAILGFYRAQPMADATGTFANLNFHVAPTAPAGMTSIGATGLATDSPLQFNYSGGVANITVVGPTISSSGFHLDPGSPMSMQFAFSSDVSASLAAGDVTLTNLTTSTVVPTGSIAVSYNHNNNTATFTFPGYPNGILPDGNYHAVIGAAGVLDPLNRPMLADATLDFYFLNGDANRDRLVDIADLRILTGHYLQSNNDFSHGDFNFDGSINAVDLGILSHNWQQALAAPAPSQPSALAVVTMPSRRPTRVVNLVL